MAQFRNVRNVRRLYGEPGYVVDLELDLEDGGGFIPATYCARPGGGGICDEVIAAVASGVFEGTISDMPPPSPPPPHATPLTQDQWFAALETNGLFAPLSAAIEAQPPAKRELLKGKVFYKNIYPYADVVAFLADNASIMPPEIAALTEQDVQAMWAAALGE